MTISKAAKKNRIRKKEFKKVCRLASRKLRYETLEERRVMAGEIAQLTYEFYALNTDGTTGRNLDPNPNDTQLEANVQLGEKFVVRTLVRDLRDSPQGVFSTMSDFNYTNADGSAAEKIKVQWGESNTISFSNGAKAGTFQLRYGANTTSNISMGLREEPSGFIVVDRNLTASNIQSAIENLPNIGVGNVLVRARNDTLYGVSFRNALARTDIPNPELFSNSLTISASNPAPVSVTVTGVDNPSPSTPLVLEAALNKTPVPSQVPLYNGGIFGRLVDKTASIPGNRVLEGVGGISSATSIPAQVAGNYFAAEDKIFVASEAGTINIRQTIRTAAPGEPSNGMTMYGGSAELKAEQVILPTAKIIVTVPPGGYRNPSNPLDVNNDASVDPLDALNIINLLNAKGASISVVGLPGPPPFYDVDGDDLVTPLDVLKIIDYLTFGGPFDGNGGGAAQLSYGFFSLNGNNLDPNPNDAILEATVSPGEQFIVRTYVKDLRANPIGVFSVYSDFNYINADGSAPAKIVFDRTASSIDYTSGASGNLVDLTATVPGKRVLQKVGRFTNRFSFASEAAGTFQPVYDTLFTARDTGVVRISQTLSQPGNEKLGVSMFLSSGNYLSDSQVVLPNATLTIREGLVATSDSFSIMEDAGSKTFDLTTNDVDRSGTSRGIIAVTQPSVGGVVRFQSNSSTIDFVPAANFYGKVTFTYTVRNNLGDQSVGTVTIDVLPANDVPTLNPISNQTLSRNASLQTVIINGISDGPGESGPVAIFVSSSNPSLIPNPALTYVSPNASGSIAFAPVADKFGASEIVVLVQDQAGLQTRQAFTVVVTPPARGYQNPINPLDVNGDGSVSPLDYLTVINLLNSRGASTSVLGLLGPPNYFDVDGDDLVTPLDALKIVDQLNASPSSSSPPLLAELTYGFYSKDGRNLDPNPNDGKLEAIVGLGEQFIVRTFIRDLRVDPRGVFSAYTDFNYTNSDGSNAAKIAFENTSSSSDYSHAANSKLVDLTASKAGQRALQKVGRTSNRTVFPAAMAGSSIAAYDTLFTAVGLGSIQLEQSISTLDSERLGISMLGGAAQYLTQSQVVLPSATIAIRNGIEISSPMTNWISPTNPTTSSFVVNAAKPGFMDAWVDFNKDGDWDDPEDQVLTKIAVATGRNIIPFTIPKSTGTSDRNARFRLSKVGGMTPNGTLQEGDFSKDIPVSFDGGSTSFPKLFVDDLGAHEIRIADGRVTIAVSGTTVWSVSANELTKLSSLDKSGNIVSELHDFSSAFPGEIKYNELNSTVELKVTASNLNLTNYGTGNVQGVQTIDLRQSGENILSLKETDVQSINSQKKLKVVMNAEDALSTPNIWSAQTGRIENNDWVQTYTNVDKDTNAISTLEVVSARPWRNEVSRLDADGDKTISPLDVLVLINAINADVFPSGTLPPRQTTSPSGFYDTDGDNFLSPLDVLQVINRINLGANGGGSGANGGGEGEKWQATDLLFAMETFVPDQDDRLPQRQSRTPSTAIRHLRKTT